MIELEAAESTILQPSNNNYYSGKIHSKDTNSTVWKFKEEQDSLIDSKYLLSPQTL